MRMITTGERRKRGCEYCANVGMLYAKGRSGMRLSCPYETCPYTELDKHATYADYMKSDENKIAFTPVEPGGGRITVGAMDKYGRRLLRSAVEWGGKW